MGSKINGITLAYTKRLDFQIRKIDDGAQKIDRSLLKTFGIVIAGFEVIDKLGRVRFFQKTLLLANTSIEIVLEIPVFTFNNADVYFNKQEFI